MPSLRATALRVYILFTLYRNPHLRHILKPTPILPSLFTAVMPATQVLFNDDILRIVIHYMHALRAKVNAAEFPDPAHEEQVLYRSSCYALARVCKSLQEPALDALWAFTYNIMHLLKILPSFYCEDPTAQKKVFVSTCLVRWSFHSELMFACPLCADARAYSPR